MSGIWSCLMSTEYTVKSGDTLSAIAQRYQTTLSSLLRLNPDIENPDQIIPGQILRLPAANDADFSSCEVGQIAQEPPCAEEIVDVVHVTGSDEFILLTAEELSEWLEEEEFVCGPINGFYKKLDKLNDGDPDSELNAADGEGQILSEVRSEEHTSELQSRPHLVCRLLLEKKKKKEIKNQIDNNANNRIVKVSATRKNKVPTRSIDQGAHAV